MTSESARPVREKGDRSKGADQVGRHIAERKLAPMLFLVSSDLRKHHHQRRRIPSPIPGENPDKTGNSCGPEFAALAQIIRARAQVRSVQI